MTIRKKIIDLLESGPLTLKDLASTLGLREREILEHLPHVSRSISPARRIQIYPAQCLHCGFAFRKRMRFSTPGKCPQCRSVRIQPPEFLITSLSPRR